MCQRSGIDVRKGDARIFDDAVDDFQSRHANRWGSDTSDICKMCPSVGVTCGHVYNSNDAEKRVDLAIVGDFGELEVINNVAYG